MNSIPLLSVIIPVFNAARYLRQAVESVLDQQHPNIEVLIVDDGSTDNSLKVAASFGHPIISVQQDNMGAGAARNHGLRLCTGEMIAFLDADDVWLQGKIQAQLAMVQERSADLVFGLAEEFLSTECTPDGAKFLVRHAPRPGLITSAALFPRSTLQRVGYLDETLIVGEFLDWYARFKEQGLQEAVVDQVVCRRRIHQHNLGIRKKSASKDYVRVMKNALDRRRLASDATAKDGGKDVL